MSGAEEEEDIEQKPTYVELFSDLVFVVAMHLVAEPLEEMESFMSMELPLYLLRVFSIWWMWQSAMAWSNMANLLFEGDDLKGWHHIVLFLTVAALAVLRPLPLPPP